MNETQAIMTHSLPSARHRRKLLLLMAVFLAPPVAAWITFHFFAHDLAVGTVNIGQLVTPARPLERFHAVDIDQGRPVDARLFHGRWTYLVFADDCGEECRRQLFLTRQVRASVNKDMPRVQRVLLLGESATAPAGQRVEHPDLRRLRMDAAERARLAPLLELDGHGLDGHSLYLFDPLGNYMMRYDLSMPPAGMLKDLRKLLKLSRIG